VEVRRYGSVDTLEPSRLHLLDTAVQSNLAADDKQVLRGQWLRISSAVSTPIPSYSSLALRGRQHITGRSLANNMGLRQCSTVH
jgi:hypothetical protein